MICLSAEQRVFTERLWVHCTGVGACVQSSSWVDWSHLWLQTAGTSCCRGT